MQKRKPPNIFEYDSCIIESENILIFQEKINKGKKCKVNI